MDTRAALERLDRRHHLCGDCLDQVQVVGVVGLGLVALQRQHADDALAAQAAAR